MSKRWVFGVLVVANVLFFAVMHWGAALTVDVDATSLQPPLSAEKIVLLESSAVSAVASAPVAASAVVETKPAAASSVSKSVCMEWGEFSGGDLLRAEKSLAMLKLNEKLKQRFVDYPSGYWVYMPPMKNKALVDQKIAQLKKMEIHDYFVIQEAGSWQNAISLGVFRTEEAAKRYLAKLQERGVRSAVVGERSSKLKYTVFLFNRLDAVQSEQLAGVAKGFSESELKQVTCN